GGCRAVKAACGRVDTAGVRPFPLRRSRPGRLLLPGRLLGTPVRLLVVGVAAAVAVAGLPGSSASAETANQAKAAAHRAAMEIRALQPKLAQALRAYRTALEQLGNDVTSGISADQLAEQAQQQVDAASLAQRQRIRALYMSGGQVGLLASLLDSSGP